MSPIRTPIRVSVRASNGRDDSIIDVAVADRE